MMADVPMLSSPSDLVDCDRFPSAFVFVKNFERQKKATV